MDATDPGHRQPVATSHFAHPSPLLLSSTVGPKVQDAGVNLKAVLLQEDEMHQSGDE